MEYRGVRGWTVAIIEKITAKTARFTCDRLLRLLVVIGFGLTLAACDKCIMPVWRHDTPAAPQSCQDDSTQPK